ncbi:MAG TPA: zinc ribbon domain-containing protein [Anaeromyxobacter sp.]|nr:zinc ribbon domain-containing protein [Anaeromyxobacter sp.]
MPIYEYVCEACGKLTEVMQRMSDPPPAACGECGSPKLARLVSRTSFQLRGGGWYSDLYSSTKGKAGGSAGATGGSGPAAPGSGGSRTGASGSTSTTTAPTPAGGPGTKSGSS